MLPRDKLYSVPFTTDESNVPAQKGKGNLMHALSTFLKEPMK
jgi:hypothetical protein